MAPAPNPSTYQSYFGKVLAKRLRYVHNINVLVAISASITLRIPYGQFWWNLLFTFVYRAPVIFVALLLIKQARAKFSTVEYSSHKTLGAQIYHTLFSVQYLKNTIFYLLSGYFIHLIFIFQLPFAYDYYSLSKEYRKNPLINDEWVFYWFYPLFLSGFYSAHHLIFQRNRLNFQYGASKLRPEDSLLSKVPSLFRNALALNIIVAILAPIAYLAVKPVIYKSNIVLILILGLDTSIPSFNVSWSTLFSISFLTYHILLAWEFVNYAFNVYATIGCLDGKKPISTYSADPINTLLSGLRNVDPEYQLSRLTAFQELSYIATTNDPEGVKLRTAIYNARSRRGFIWPAILDECSLIIKETTARVNYRSASDLKVLKQNQLTIKEELRSSSSSKHVDESDIFGNSILGSPSKSPLTQNTLRNYSEIDTKKNTSPSIFNNKWYKFADTQFFIPLKAALSSALDVNSSNNKAHPIIIKLRKAIESITKQYKVYNDRFLSTNIGIFFRTTLKRDTESRVINAVNFGNATIAISNLLMHSIEEDKNGTITNSHICDVLNLLEKPIRATSNYTDYLPDSVFLSGAQKRDKRLTKNHLIAVLHDLAMSEFYQICIKFNYKLNDLVLNARAYKLAKWVIDVAIADQQQQHIKVGL
ncbi:nuclear envelope protein [Scheffersomyces xylosifermentans]|uniref:nuclear envelope protein n=1 Tax=Scheffersomyces xylosifermentans TaxID=1304137 RepID=UPI00315D682C